MEWRNLPPIRNRIERRLVFSPPFEGGVGGVLVTSINPTLIPAVILSTLPIDLGCFLVYNLLQVWVLHPREQSHLSTTHTGNVSCRVSAHPATHVNSPGDPPLNSPGD